MSSSYINPSRNHQSLVVQIREILAGHDYPESPEDALLLLLDKLSYRLSALYLKRTFSTDDCVTTAESLRKLFEPSEVTEFSSVDQLEDLLLSDTKNYFQIEVHGDLSFHIFVVIVLGGKTYMLQSYVGKYSLQVTEIDPLMLISALRNGDVEEYNLLFGTTVKREGPVKHQINVEGGTFTVLPLTKLIKELEFF